MFFPQKFVSFPVKQREKCHRIAESFYRGLKKKSNRGKRFWLLLFILDSPNPCYNSFYPSVYFSSSHHFSICLFLLLSLSAMIRIKKKNRKLSDPSRLNKTLPYISKPQPLSPSIQQNESYQDHYNSERHFFFSPQWHPLKWPYKEWHFLFSTFNTSLKSWRSILQLPSFHLPLHTLSLICSL